MVRMRYDGRSWIPILISMLALLGAGITSGCSTALVSAAPTEEELVPAGATKAQVEKKLGLPFESEALDDPGSTSIEKASYRYVGLIKKKGNLGDTIGANLMTLGLAEFEMGPKAMRESTREHIVIVWFDRSGRVVRHWVLDGNLTDPKKQTQ